MTTNYSITPVKCPFCGYVSVYPFTRIAETPAGKHIGIMSMKCSTCGWMSDKTMDIENFIAWQSEGIEGEERGDHA